MGTLSMSIRKMALQKIGLAAFDRKKNIIEKMWDEIEQVLNDLDLTYEKVRLYQDGLPLCGKEVEIVKELAEAGSRNHGLLLRLIEMGAKIMGTESSELLVEEYQLIKQVMMKRPLSDSTDSIKRGDAASMKTPRKSLSDKLLRKRDQFIANRINETLGPGETGILFLGMLHAVENLLDRDIRVIYPIYRPLKP